MSETSKDGREILITAPSRNCDSRNPTLPFVCKGFSYEQSFFVNQSFYFLFFSSLDSMDPNCSPEMVL